MNASSLCHSNKPQIVRLSLEEVNLLGFPISREGALPGVVYQQRRCTSWYCQSADNVHFLELPRSREGAFPGIVYQQRSCTSWCCLSAEKVHFLGLSISRESTLPGIVYQQRMCTSWDFQSGEKAVGGKGRISLLPRVTVQTDTSLVRSEL
ncbi:hypothetical protein J6590_028114 [Homalodisca vitripennis]|nr:hypothetical protein J6590_028114 [Homalodisca vitripennis]